jgi:hypothetical protein
MRGADLRRVVRALFGAEGAALLARHSELAAAAGGGVRPEAFLDFVFLEQLVPTVRARPGRLRARSILHSKLLLHGAFLWARRRLTGQNGGFRPGQDPAAVDALLLLLLEEEAGPLAAYTVVGECRVRSTVEPGGGVVLGNLQPGQRLTAVAVTTVGRRRRVGFRWGEDGSGFQQDGSGPVQGPEGAAGPPNAWTSELSKDGEISHGR